MSDDLLLLRVQVQSHKFIQLVRSGATIRDLAIAIALHVEELYGVHNNLLTLQIAGFDLDPGYIVGHVLKRDDLVHAVTANSTPPGLANAVQAILLDPKKRTHTQAQIENAQEIKVKTEKKAKRKEDDSPSKGILKAINTPVNTPVQSGGERSPAKVSFSPVAQAIPPPVFASVVAPESDDSKKKKKKNDNSKKSESAKKNESAKKAKAEKSKAGEEKKSESSTPAPKVAKEKETSSSKQKASNQPLKEIASPAKQTPKQSVAVSPSPKTTPKIQPVAHKDVIIPDVPEETELIISDSDTDDDSTTKKGKSVQAVEFSNFREQVDADERGALKKLGLTTSSSTSTGKSVARSLHEGSEKVVNVLKKDATTLASSSPKQKRPSKRDSVELSDDSDSEENDDAGEVPKWMNKSQNLSDSDSESDDNVSVQPKEK
jgi:hypothetical protein